MSTTTNTCLNKFQSKFTQLLVLSALIVVLFGMIGLAFLYNNLPLFTDQQVTRLEIQQVSNDENLQPTITIPTPVRKESKDNINLEKAMNNSTIPSTNINYYLIIGNCDKNFRQQQKSMILNLAYLDRLKEMYPHWIILNTLMSRYINSSLKNSTYSHSIIISMTKELLPQIDVNKDKYQWIFNVDCAFLYRDLKIKEYYGKLYGSNDDDDDGLDIKQFKIHNPTKGMMDNKDNKTYLHWSHEVVMLSNNYAMDYDSIGGIIDERYLNAWINNSYFDSNIKELIPLEYGRPLLIEETGEAYDLVDSSKLDCNYIDINMQRCYSWPRKGCISMNTVQGINQFYYAYENINPKNLALMNVSNLITNSQQHETNVNINIDLSKLQFCAMAVKTFYISRYHIDAIMRHVFHHILSKKYKYCHHIGNYHPHIYDKYENITKPFLCSAKLNSNYTDYHPTYHHLLALCFNNYKFTINFENTLTHGYTSEKIYTGLLSSNTIPIYFGNIDIFKLINKDRIIYCQIPNDVMINARIEWQTIRRSMFNQTRRIFNYDAIMIWAEKKFKKYLMPCIDQVIKIDNNDTLFWDKVNRNILPKNSFENSFYDATPVALGISDVLKILKSPLFS